MTWKKIIQEWNKQDFNDLIFKKTVHGIINDPDKQIKEDWQGYLDWLELEFSSQEVSKQIALLWNSDNQTKLDNLIADSNWEDVKSELRYTYTGHDDLLNAIKTSAIQKIDQDWDVAKNNIFVQTFTNIYPQIIENAKKELKESNIVDELTFLYVSYKKLLLTDFPKIVEQFCKEEPSIELKGLPQSDITNIEKLINDYVRDQEIGVENNQEIYWARYKLVQIALEIAESVVEAKQAKMKSEKGEDLTSKFNKLKEFAKWQTGTIKELIKAIYGYQQNQSSSSGGTTPSNTTGETTPDNSRPPTPTPTPPPNNDTKPIEPQPQPIPTPPKPEETPEQKLEREWNNFFNKHSGITDKETWKSFTNPTDAELIYKNGWTSLTQGITNLNQTSKSFSYTQEGYTVDGIEPLKFVKKDGIAYFFQQVSVIKDKSITYDQLAGRFTDTNIQSMISKFSVPSSITVEVLKKMRDDKLTQLLQGIKNNALLKDNENNDWDPALEEIEKKQINDASNVETIGQLQTQFKTKRDSIKTATTLLDQIKNCDDITTLPKMADIRNAYNEELVPSDLKYIELKKARNEVRLTLFKDRFEKPTKTGLSDTEIDKWRDSSDATGLDGLGAEERTAFLNGWKIEEIKDKKIALYKVGNEQVQNFDPLKVDKKQLEKALGILVEINDSSKTTFKSLPADFKKADIASLPTNLPGNANPTYLTARIKARRDTFFLSLNKVDDDAFDQEKYDTILTKIKEKYAQKEYKPFTAEIANKVLAYNVPKDLEYVKVPNSKEQKLKKLPPLSPTIDEDLDDWLTSEEQKGYRIEKEPEQIIKGKEMNGEAVLKQENEWIETKQRDKQGKLLLPFFCAKVGYDPNQPEKFFCEEGNSTKGCIPFSTGIGKSTKTMMCLEFIMEQVDNIWKQTDKRRNIVLVLPTEVLASSVANHHNGWLQEYECPIHDIKHGEYKVNKDEIGEGLSILYFPYLLGYVASSKAKYKGTENGKAFDLFKQITDKEAQGKLNTVKENADLFKKLDPILVFDEADFADGEYRATMEGCVMQGLKVMKMSATFPGVPWSITTSYPLTTRKVDGFKDEHIKPEDKTAIFIRNKLLPEQKKILEDAGVCYVEFDASMAPAVEGITIGMPPGTVFFMTFIYDRGVSMDIKNVIITNWIETTKLGDFDNKATNYKGKGVWFYADPVPQKSPIGSLGQQRGRVSRLYPGNCYILVGKDGVLEYEEIQPTDDVGTVFTKAVFSGDTSQIRYKMFKDSLNLTLLSLAWPDKFGLRPEEILVGVNQGGVPPNVFPKFIGEKGKPSQGCDDDLWGRHMRVAKVSEMPKDQAKGILAQMIGNLVVSPGKVNNFPNLVSVEIESPLTAYIGWLADTKPKQGKTPNDPVSWVKQDNKASIAECQSMINGAVEQWLQKLPDYKTGQVQYKNEKTFKKIVDVYKCMAGMKISITQEFTDDWINPKNKDLGKKPKDNLTLKILYTSNGGNSKRTFHYDNKREREREREASQPK